MDAHLCRRRIATVLAALMVSTALASCGPSTPPPGASTRSSSPAVLGIDWDHAASVERPVNYEATLNPSEKIPEHPILRIPGQAIMADVAAATGGSLVAVGYIPPDFTAAAWMSGDGSTWSLHSIDTTAFTFAVGVAVNVSGTIVAVGRARGEPVAWTSADGSAWERHSAPVLDPRTFERITTVIATDNGFVAGGSAGPELSDRHARFWTSTDGRTWEAVADDPAAFGNAEVRAITRRGTTLVAIGEVGSAQAPKSAVAWLSSDGARWTRVDDPAFAGGVAASVVAAPFGGFLAVGYDIDRHNALVWTSRDGRQWNRVAQDPSRSRNPGFVWMTDAATIADAVVATGGVQPNQRGTAMSWVSRDGTHWQQSNVAPVQEQGEFYAITPGGPGAVVVGAFGGPDSYVPTVWLSPAR
jgi:hypothetical protein